MEGQQRIQRSFGNLNAVSQMQRPTSSPAARAKKHSLPADMDEHIDEVSRALKAMSHPLRLHILFELGDQELNVQSILDNVNTSQSNISQHLAILHDRGVLRTRKDGNRVYYRVADTRMLQLVSFIRDVFLRFHAMEIC